MRHADAIEILQLADPITKAAIQQAWREMVTKYHPDRNPAGEEMIKLVNAARDALQDFTGTRAEAGTAQENWGEAINNALNAIFDLDGLDIEICGAWVWVGGNTREHKDALKGAGFKWASKKKKWNFRPAGWRSASRGGFTMDKIRAAHGSQKPGRPYQRPEAQRLYA